jgi:hypothetical protein
MQLRTLKNLGKNHVNKKKSWASDGKRAKLLRKWALGIKVHANSRIHLYFLDTLNSLLMIKIANEAFYYASLASLKKH